MLYRQLDLAGLATMLTSPAVLNGLSNSYSVHRGRLGG